MAELPDNSVALMVTSPPCHVGKDYDAEGSFEDYLEMLQRVMAEVHRVLEPGGRAAVNVANLGRRPYLPLSTAAPHHGRWRSQRLGACYWSCYWNQADPSGTSGLQRERQAPDQDRSGRSGF